MSMMMLMMMVIIQAYEAIQQNPINIHIYTTAPSSSIFLFCTNLFLFHYYYKNSYTRCKADSIKSNIVSAPKATERNVHFLSMIKNIRCLALSNKMSPFLAVIGFPVITTAPKECGNLFTRFAPIPGWKCTNAALQNLC